MIRLPKLYHDDKAPALVSPNGDRVETTANGVFDLAYRQPARFGLGSGLSIGDTVEALTGYRTIRQEFAYGFADRSRFTSARAWDEIVRSLNDLRPAYQSAFAVWVYRRDVLLAYLPRLACSECGGRLPKPRNGVYAECTQRCRRFEASPQFTRVNEREKRKYWEHFFTPVCSPACHEKVATVYRRITLELMEKRRWMEQGKQLLNDVRELLPEKYQRGRRRKASTSHSAASTHRTTSETS